MNIFLKRHKFRGLGILCIILSQIGTLPESILPTAILWALAAPISILLFLPLSFEELFSRQKYFLHFITIYIIFFIIGGSKIFQYNRSSSIENTFSLMSYNVSVFNVYGYLNHDFKESKTLIDWIETTNTDIYCFQEYYNCESNKKKHNPNQLFNTKKSLGKNRGYNVFAPAFLTNHINATFGLAIFSKFPILSKNSISFSKIGGSTTNGIISADIQISNKDTIRVMNCHLQSIILNNGETNYKNRWERWTQTLLKIHKGAIQREKQVNLVIKLINESPYPVILTGDFNEPVLGYSYFTLKTLLNNTFEDKGNGLGITLRDIPLRIDQTFYDNHAFDLKQFSTDHSCNASDHYPILSWFKIK